MSETPDEVLAAMAEAAAKAVFDEICADPTGVDLSPAVQAALTAAKDLGWQLVPIAATDEMIEEGCGIDCTRTVCKARLECRDDGGRATMREKWDAMLAVVPRVVA